MDNTKEFTHISLCTGYGGIDIGLKRAIGNIRTIAYSEIEAYAVCNLLQKIEAGHLDAAPIWTNLKTFPWKQFYKKVGILSGGFPCQPFSSSGERKADEDPRHLWPYIAKGIKYARPSIVFFENVHGILSAKLRGKEWADTEGTPVLLHVLRELERMDYTAEAGVFSAAECGATHNRERVFIFAVHNKAPQKFKNLLNKSINRATEYSGTKSFFKKGFRTAYPMGKGRNQYEWEPHRTLVNTCSIRRRMHLQNPIISKAKNKEKKTDKYSRSSETMGGACNAHRENKLEMVRELNGSTHRLDHDRLYRSYCDRKSEVRLIGNGVVPDTAKKAFITLWHKVQNPPPVVDQLELGF